MRFVYLLLALIHPQNNSHVISHIDSQQIPITERYLNNVQTPVIIIDSTGGEGISALAIGDMIENAEAACIVPRVAASAAFYLLQRCRLRVMHRGALIMMHEPYAVISRPSKISINQAEMMFKSLSVLHSIMSNSIIKRSGINPSFYFNKVKNDWWIDSETAKKLNLVDIVLD